MDTQAGAEKERRLGLQGTLDLSLSGAQDMLQVTPMATSSGAALPLRSMPLALPQGPVGASRGVLL